MESCSFLCIGKLTRPTQTLHSAGYIWKDLDIRAQWVTFCWLTPLPRGCFVNWEWTNVVNFFSNITTSYLFAILNMTRRLILTILCLNILKQTFFTTSCRKWSILPRLLRKGITNFQQNSNFRRLTFEGISMENAIFGFQISKFIQKSIRNELQRPTRFSFFKFHHDFRSVCEFSQMKLLCARKYRTVVFGPSRRWSMK